MPNDPGDQAAFHPVFNTAQSVESRNPVTANRPIPAFTRPSG
jgi:hypothetical protein